MKYLILAISLLTISCGHDAFEIDQSFDGKQFKSMRGGCDNNRVPFIELLQKKKDVLLSHSENEILATLGRYDFQILDERNQKVFVYYLEPGPHCEQIQNPSEAQSMAVYFNAVSLAKEITFQKGMP